LRSGRTYFVLLLVEWKNRGLEAFRNVVFQDASALTQAYAKRRYLVDYIERKREAGQTLKESVAVVDATLGTNTLTFCLCQLQAANNMIVRQVKRCRAVVDTPADNSEATPPRARARARARCWYVGTWVLVLLVLQGNTVNSLLLTEGSQCTKSTVGIQPPCWVVGGNCNYRSWPPYGV
jgi:hypothetical protein